MLLTSGNLAGLTTGFTTAFNKGIANAPTHWAEVAMKVPSQTRENSYAWLGDMPGIREWIGDRVVHELTVDGYKVVNRPFEETVSVKRTDIEDDMYGVYGPLFEKLGFDAARHPDKLVFGLMAKGFATKAYDGQYFFDTDHPVRTGVGDEVVSVSNMQAGVGAPWYLLDCRQPIRPLIYQERLPFEFTSLDQNTDRDVFFKDLYVYGSRGRSNAGFGLWQLAFASQDTLTADNYELARQAMLNFTNDAGEALGVMPTHLVVPPQLEGAGRRILKALNADGGTNEWAGSAELIVTPFLR